MGTSHRRSMWDAAAAAAFRTKLNEWGAEACVQNCSSAQLFLWSKLLTLASFLRFFVHSNNEEWTSRSPL